MTATRPEWHPGSWGRYPARDRIRSEAINILLNGESDAFSVDRLAKRAGCSRRSFYNTFLDIEALHAQIMSGWLNQVEGQLDRLELSVSALIDVLTSTALRGVLISIATIPVGRSPLRATYHGGPRPRLIERLHGFSSSQDAMAACEALIVGSALNGNIDTGGLRRLVGRQIDARAESQPPRTIQADTGAAQRIR